MRKGGFEPPRLSAPPPQDGVSASSTTSAGKTAIANKLNLITQIAASPLHDDMGTRGSAPATLFVLRRNEPRKRRADLRRHFFKFILSGLRNSSCGTPFRLQCISELRSLGLVRNDNWFRGKSTAHSDLWDRSRQSLPCPRHGRNKE